MGMNFYKTTNPCQTCHHQPEKMHIGKSSMGWQFHFRGYRTHFDNNNKLLRPIVSYSDWITVLKAPGVVILNEDRETLSLEEFLALVEEKQSKLNDVGFYNVMTENPKTDSEREYVDRRMRDRSYSHGDYGVYDRVNRNSWIDIDGYSFTDCDFS